MVQPRPWRAGWLIRSAAAAVLLVPAVLGACGCDPAKRQADPPVVVYTSVDQQLAEPILRSFTDRTGLRVLPIYDTEATKTTGLVNRLIAEKASPRADVFWNSEVIRTVLLRREGVLAPYDSPQAGDVPRRYRDAEGYWTGQALRARVIVWDPARTDTVPSNLERLADEAWRGRVAMAYPLFGTTGSHVAALFSRWGVERTTRWLRAIDANDVSIVDGNSTARDLVAAGGIDAALTDTDDFAVALKRGDSMQMHFADAAEAGTFVIPATVALIREGPNPDGGRRLIDYLLSSEVEEDLVRGEGAFMPIRDDADWPERLPPRERLHPMDVDYEAVADQLEDAMLVCRDLFVRR